MPGSKNVPYLTVNLFVYASQIFLIIAHSEIIRQDIAHGDNFIKTCSIMT